MGVRTYFSYARMNRNGAMYNHSSGYWDLARGKQVAPLVAGILSQSIDCGWVYLACLCVQTSGQGYVPQARHGCVSDSELAGDARIKLSHNKLVSKMVPICTRLCWVFRKHDWSVACWVSNVDYAVMVATYFAAKRPIGKDKHIQGRHVRWLGWGAK